MHNRPSVSTTSTLERGGGRQKEREQQREMENERDSKMERETDGKRDRKTECCREREKDSERQSEAVRDLKLQGSYICPIVIFQLLTKISPVSTLGGANIDQSMCKLHLHQ